MSFYVYTSQGIYLFDIYGKEPRYKGGSMPSYRKVGMGLRETEYGVFLKIHLDDGAYGTPEYAIFKKNGQRLMKLDDLEIEEGETRLEILQDLIEKMESGMITTREELMEFDKRWKKAVKREDPMEKLFQDVMTAILNDKQEDFWKRLEELEKDKQ